MPPGLLPDLNVCCRLFGRALQYVGIDWHAFKVFDKWIAYEEEQHDLQQVAKVYSVAICTPSQDLQRLNAAFLKFAAEHSVQELLTEAEVQQYTEEARRNCSASAAQEAAQSVRMPEIDLSLYVAIQLWETC